jgi:Tol biopolymer transport system component
MNADGSNQTNLTRTSSINEVLPDWSPDDSKIGYARWSEAYHDYIYVVNADGTGAHPITGDEHNEHPVWSPDGTRIAFNSGRGGRLRNIYVMSADGSNPIRLTDRDEWATDWW